VILELHGKTNFHVLTINCDKPVKKMGWWFIIHYLIQLTVHVTINICNLVMLFLHVFAPISHLQGGHLQRNTFIKKNVFLCVFQCIFLTTMRNICICLNTFKISQYQYEILQYMYIWFRFHTHTSQCYGTSICFDELYWF
jgi:hypothetical protein